MAIVVALAALIAAAFGIAWPVVDRIYSERIANYEIKLAAARSETSVGQSRSRAGVEPVASKVGREIEAEKQVEDSQKDYGKVFEAGSFFPIEFEEELIGAKLSSLRSRFPNGRVTSLRTFTEQIKSGPFIRVLFYFTFSDEADPEVEYVTFLFRDDRAARHVRAEAATSFVGVRGESIMLGHELRWSNDSLVANLDAAGYTIRKSPSSSPLNQAISKLEKALQQGVSAYEESSSSRAALIEEMSELQKALEQKALELKAIDERGQGDESSR